MIRQLVASTTDPADVHPQLAAHQAEMIRRCPYLGPSVDRGLTVWSAYSADADDHRDLLALLVRYAEHVRTARRVHGPLVCRNVAILGPEDTSAAKALMDWPAWLARNLYVPVQIVVDRFWIGLGRGIGRGQSVMPAPAVSFFMIRCGIARRDRVIVAERSPERLAWLRSGPGDDGRDVIRSAVGRRLAEPAASWDDLVSLFPLPQR